MTIGPTLTTERLILRPPTHADFDRFAEMSAEEDTMRFIGGVARLGDVTASVPRA